MKSWFSKYFLITTGLTVLALFLHVFPSQAQNGVKWLTWGEAMKLSQMEKRKIIVDVYTDWCGWCKRMEKNTFQQSQIAEYLNDNYYCVKFDAEQREPILFKGRTYRYVRNSNRGYHELAEKIMNGRLSFPTTVFLDENFNVIQPIVGYKKPETFEKIISYFATDSYKSTPWAVYEKNYQPAKKEKGDFVQKGGN